MARMLELSNAEWRVAREQLRDLAANDDRSDLERVRDRREMAAWASLARERARVAVDPEVSARWNRLAWLAACDAQK